MARAKLRRAKKAREAVNTERAQAIKDAHREPIYDTAKSRAAGMLGLAIVSLAVAHVSRWVRDDRNKVRYPATFAHPPSGGQPSPSSTPTPPSPSTLPEGPWKSTWEHLALQAVDFLFLRAPASYAADRERIRAHFSSSEILAELGKASPLFCTMRRRRAISN